MDAYTPMDAYGYACLCMHVCAGVCMCVCWCVWMDIDDKLVYKKNL